MDVEANLRYKTLWRETGLTYGGEPLPIHNKPYLISQTEALSFKTKVETLQGMVERITVLFLKGQFHDIFRFDENLLKLIQANPGFSAFCPFARWDSFYDGKNLKFLELNTDGTSGMVYMEELNRVYTQVFHAQGVETSSLKEDVLRTLLRCYQGFSKKRSEKPQISIVDWADVATRSEQEALCWFFKEKGYSTILADPRKLSYDGKALYDGDFRIDLIYRRVVTGEYLNALEKLHALTESYLDKNVCMVGSFRSQIGFDKRVFVILSCLEFDSLFSPFENQLRRECIPWTRLLKSGTTSFNDRTIELLDFLIQNPEQFILKPPSLNRGQGIIFGSQVSQQTWQNAIHQHLDTGYIVQERLPIPQWDGMGFHLGHFIFGGKLSGWMGRISSDPFLHEQAQERWVPCFLSEHKN